MKLIRAKKFLACLFLGLACFVRADAVHAEEILRVGIFHPITGYIEKDAEGYYHGADSDYVQAVANYAGFRCQMFEGSVGEVLNWLQEGKIDVVTGLVETSERRQTMDFSRLPMGKEHSLLYWRGESEKNVGRVLRIGFLQSLYQSPELTEILRREKFSFAPRSFDSLEAMRRAYDAEEIDGFVTSGQMRLDVPVAAAFEANYLRFAVKKGNTALLRRLDWAADQLAINDPELTDRLYRKYSARGSDIPLPLLPEEREYLAKKKILRAVAPTHEKPYSYLENGEFRGILADLAERIASDLGVEIELVAANNADEAFLLLQNGDADMVMNFYSDYGWAARNKILVTEPYFTTFYTVVTKRGANIPSRPRVASLKDRYYTRVYFSENELKIDPVPCDTVDECLRAVQNGRADMAILREITAQYNLYQGSYPELMIRDGRLFSHDVSIGVSPADGSLLLRILDKEINYLGRDTVRDMVREGIAGAESSRSLRSLFFTYPVHFLIGIAISGLLLLLLFIRMNRMRRQHIEQMQTVLFSDLETGLHNRHWLEQEIWRLLKRSGYAGGEAAHYFVAIFQLPRMDVLVDAYGRKWVAQVLSAVAKRLERQGSWVKAVALRSAGGQVLAFFAETNQEKLNEFIQKFLRENEFVDIGELKAKVSFQVGVAPITDSEKIQHAMDDADLAAHETYNVQFFDDSLREQKQLQYRIESLMDKALAAGEFAVWYQPKYDIRTQKCVGAEALVRWNSPEMGFLMPGRFIGLFEQNGFVTKLDFYILETVFKFQKAQLDADAPIVTVSVNQSRLHMREQGYLEKIKALADKYGETSLVELELTETAFDVGVREREQAMTVVRSLKEMGFALSMDDFGSGYSDISLLNILPMDVMKLDRSLLTASENSKRMQIVLSQVIQLGRKLGMDVICEGIETKEQEELLIECGCYKGQGFLYAKPMPEEDFRAFLAERA